MHRSHRTHHSKRIISNWNYEELVVARLIWHVIQIFTYIFIFIC